MRITIVLGAFLPVPPVMGGAVEKIWLALAEEFARSGHEVTLISRAYEGFPPNESSGGVRHLRVKGYDTPASLLLLKLCDFFYSLRARAALPTADILVTNTFWLPMLLRDQGRGQLYVHVARFPKGQMRFYRHAARLQTVSQAVARAIEREVPEMKERVCVIPNPLPQLADESEPPAPSAREKIMLYVGRLHPEKGVHLLLEAFAALGARADGWRLVVVGPAEAKFGGGGEAYLTQLRAIAGGHAIEFRGAIFDQAALAREYRRARLFVYPSLAETGESFGLAPLEAMAHGCPVLVSSLECFRDFIEDNATGFVFDHRAAQTAAALRERLAQLIAEPAQLDRVGAEGWRKARGYSVANVAHQLLDDFRSLLDQSGGQEKR